MPEKPYVSPNPLKRQTRDVEPPADPQPDAGSLRMAAYERETERQQFLVDPMTHPSSGDPPAAVSPDGSRMGTAPEEKAKK